MSSTVSAPIRESRRASKLVTRLGAQEFRRRLWHFLPGVLALILTAVPHYDPIRLSSILLLLVVGIALPTLLALRNHCGYCRHPEEDGLPGVLGFTIPLSLLTLLCRAHPEIPLAATAILSFGDGSATLTGLLTRGPRVFWNRRKSVAGSLAFLVVGTTMATLIYWLEASPQIRLETVLLCVAPAVAVCAFVESLPLRINDNISVGFGSGLVLMLMQTLLIGWGN
jgi:dolichol kinase